MTPLKYCHVYNLKSDKLHCTLTLTEETKKERGNEDMEKETEKERGNPGTR